MAVKSALSVMEVVVEATITENSSCRTNLLTGVTGSRLAIRFPKIAHGESYFTDTPYSLLQVLGLLFRYFCLSSG